jgi:vancomycin permeability regulator SanA
VSVFAGVLIYLSIFITIGNYAKQLVKNPPTQKADAALILGNCAFLNGRPNPCLTGRVDEGLALTQQDLVSTLVMSGGLDDEDKRIESVTMEAHAISKGFQGKILLESRSSSTLEILTFSRPILEAAGVKSVIITSELYHMWRVKKLVDAGHLGKDFNVSYVATPSPCWMAWGMLFKGALREPLAVINNH